MNPIEYLLDWRLDSFLKKYNVRLEDFSTSKDISVRKLLFKNIAKQLLPKKSYSDSERKKYINYGYWLIKNVIWKNITTYTLRPFDNSEECEICITRIYSNQQEIFVSINWNSFDRNSILNRSYCNTFSKDNLDKLWYLIINHFMLIDTIIIEHALSDLTNIVKELIYNMILIKN